MSGSASGFKDIPRPSIRNIGFGAATLMVLVFKMGALGCYYLDRSGRSVDHIVKSKVNDLQLMVQQIASATEEMTATSEGISKYIDPIATISKETSSASTQVSQASGELASLSVSLQDIVKEFSV